MYILSVRDNKNGYKNALYRLLKPNGVQKYIKFSHLPFLPLTYFCKIHIIVMKKVAYYINRRPFFAKKTRIVREFSFCNNSALINAEYKIVLNYQKIVDLFTFSVLIIALSLIIYCFSLMKQTTND